MPSTTRKHNLSEAADRALRDLKLELTCWPAYTEAVSSSTAIELLCWYWKMVRRERLTEVNPLEHRPLTSRRGRKAERNAFENTRPAKIRNEIEKAQKVD